MGRRILSGWQRSNMREENKIMFDLCVFTLSKVSLGGRNNYSIDKKNSFQV
jgi:hypothetical protein